MNNNNTPNTITIQLTKGQSTIIDSKHEDLALMKWYSAKKKESYYVSRYVPLSERTNNQKHEYLARVVLSRKLGRELEKHERADHIDLNPLNNLESNIRLASHAENNRNKPRLSINTSGYKGVYKHKNSKRWFSMIKVDYKPIYLGYFDTKEEAYQAYCEAALKYHGEFARLE